MEEGYLGTSSQKREPPIENRKTTPSHLNGNGLILLKRNKVTGEKPKYEPKHMLELICSGSEKDKKSLRGMKINEG